MLQIKYFTALLSGYRAIYRHKKFKNHEDMKICFTYSFFDLTQTKQIQRNLSCTGCKEQKGKFRGKQIPYFEEQDSIVN